MASCCGGHNTDKEGLSESLILFLDELRSWKGTPFVLGIAKKKVGTDCTNFIIQSAITIYPEVSKMVKGFVQVRPRSVINNIPDYLKEIDPDGKTVCEIEGIDYKPGDIVIFRIGKYLAHCAVYLGDGEFIHSFKGDGVQLIRPAGNWLKQIEKVFRLRRLT